jgi:hypothetical protein
MGTGLLMSYRIMLTSEKPKTCYSIMKQALLHDQMWRLVQLATGGAAAPTAAAERTEAVTKKYERYS